MRKIPEIERKVELDNCNGVKAILMLCIVLYHSMAFYMGGGWSPYTPIPNSPILGYVAEWLNSFHVYGFTMISGYIFYALKIERGRYSKYIPFVANKAKRLIVPYVFIALIWVVPTYIYFYGTKDILSKYLLGINPSQLWFLLMLFWVFAGFWWLSKIIDKYPVFGAVISVALYLLSYMCSFMPNVLCIKTAMQYTVFFYLGFILRKYGTEIFMRLPTLLYLGIDITVFIVLQSISAYTGVLFSICTVVLSLFLHIFGAVMAFVILQRLVNKLGNQNRLLTFFSRHSMAIYLVHQQLIYFTIMWLNGVVSPIIQVCINFVFALSISTMFAWLMSKTKITRFLIGSGGK